MLSELAEGKGVQWQRSPGSDTRRSGSTRTAASGSTSILLGGPTCPDNEREPERVDAIGITHGHGDHGGDAVGLQAKFGCPVFGMVELLGWFEAQGLPSDKSIGFNKGGTIEVDRGQSHDDERLPLELGPRWDVHGRARGFVFHLEDGNASISPATPACSATCS